MKRTYKMTLRVKGANVEFHEGMGIGVLGSQEVTFDLPSDMKSDDFRLVGSLDKLSDDLMRDCVCVDIEEVK